MNLFALNGGTLNGSAARVLIYAAAAFACSADVSAAGVRQQDALAPLSSGAQFEASATCTRNGAAEFTSEGWLYPTASHTHVADSYIVGFADVQAFVLRQQTGQAYFEGAASVVAIPASVLGGASATASAGVSAEATKIQPGISDVSTTAVVVISVEPTVTRMVTANMPCSAGVRVEPAINGVAYSYADFTASGELTAAGVSYPVDAAILYAVADVEVVATHIHAGVGESIDVTAEFSSDGVLQQSALAHVNGYAGASADGFLIKLAFADVLAQATSTPVASLTHLSAISVFDGQAFVSATGEAVRMASVDSVGCTSDVSAWAIRVHAAATDVQASADFIASAITNADSYDPPGRTFIRQASATFIRPYAFIEFKRVA